MKCSTSAWRVGSQSITNFMRRRHHGDAHDDQRSGQGQRIFRSEDGLHDRSGGIGTDDENNEVNVVDVRAAEDYAQGHIPGAVNLPKDQWSSLKGLRKDKTNVLYCYSQVCHLAASAGVEFAGKGYPVMELEGGWRWWKEDGFEVEK